MVYTLNCIAWIRLVTRENIIIVDFIM